MSTIREQVTNFHLAMGSPILMLPTIPADDRVRLRASLIMEEAFETLEALFGADMPMLCSDGGTHTLKDVKAMVLDGITWTRPNGQPPYPTPTKVDLVAFADGCADLDYVVEGSRLEFGLNGERIAEVVHTANMKKVGGPIREDGKRLKPPGWRPPDIERELRVQTNLADDQDQLHQRRFFK